MIQSVTILFMNFLAQGIVCMYVAALSCGSFYSEKKCEGEKWFTEWGEGERLLFHGGIIMQHPKKERYVGQGILNGEWARHESLVTLVYDTGRMKGMCTVWMNGERSWNQKSLCY